MESKSLCDKDILEKFYTCPICDNIFDSPCKPNVCEHIFCSNCLTKTLSLTEEVRCPICRLEFDKSKIQRVAQLQAQMKTLRYQCHECNNVVGLVKLNQHFAKCIDLTKQVSMGNLSRDLAAKQPKAVNRYTFACPFCSESHFDSKGVIEHCLKLHSKEKQNKVCPICSIMPWGDQNQLSSNLIQHMIARHNFDYDTFVDFNEQEDEMLNKAILESLQYN